MLKRRIGDALAASVVSWGWLALAPAGRAAETPPSPYNAFVNRYMAAMMEFGRDTQGPQKTGLFLGALDRSAKGPLTTRPPAPAGLREEERVGPPGGALTGANPQHHQNLLRVMYVMADLTEFAPCGKAADEELTWFMNNAASKATGLLPWGAALSWDVMKDEPASGRDPAVHAFFRPWVLWDKCFALAPEAGKRFALGLWEHQIADPGTGAFDRYAAFAKHGPGDTADEPRDAGFFIRTWAAAYAHTKDEAFLRAIDVVLGRFEKRRNPKTGLLAVSSGASHASPAQSLSLAIDCAAAAARVPPPLASRLRAFAAREDEVFCAFPHDVKEQGGFATSVDCATGKPSGPLTPLWDPRDGGRTTATLAMLCVSRYENGGSGRFRDRIAAAADAYAKSLPGPDDDVWPGTFGHAISLQLAAWRATSRAAYFDRAKELAKVATETFWGDNPLPRASVKSDHYEAVTGADTLAVSLLELWCYTLGIHGLYPPANTIDR